MRKPVILILAVFLSLLSADGAFALPSFQEVRAAHIRSDAVLLDRHGEVIHERRTSMQDRRLDWVSLKDISPSLLKAVIVSEDRRFHEHKGMDWQALTRAAMGNLFSRNARGASTISMQCAAMLDGGKPAVGRRTVRQKLEQIKAAQKLEKRWSKGEILEAYLNLLHFRGELQGIGAAARGLFGKEPGGLNEAESLILAALIRSPNAPVGDVAARACRLRVAMTGKTACGDLEDTAHESLNRPYRLKPSVALAPHVADTLLKQGVSKTASTLDAGLQRFALETLAHQVNALREQNVHDGAMLVVDNLNGEVLAYVANTGDASSARYVDGVRARRQAGSILKPFLYALAFDKRILTPASLLDDSPVDIPTPRGIYRPDNYDHQYQGMVTARTALASSLNIPAVEVVSLLGPDTFVAKLRELGFDQLLDGDFYGPSLALGTADVSLWELVGAYQAMANYGVWREPVLTAWNKQGKAGRVFSKGATFLISNILSDREARSGTFGLENPLATRFWTAVKTGTSKDMRDNWCVGYSDRYTVGVWVGNFNGAPMWNVSGVSGAAPVWVEVMNHLHAGRPGRAPSPSPEVSSREVVLSHNRQRFEEWFIKGTEPDTSLQQKTVLPARISYPVNNMVIAADPDIPTDQQKVVFEAVPGGGDVKWVLNGNVMGEGSVLAWKPQGGNYRLALLNTANESLDEVSFIVKE